jgi:hypothetical protein
MSLYETHKLYKLNPCDIDTASVFKPIANILMRVTAVFTTQCSCCSGARIITGLILAAAIGRYTA